MNFNYYLNFFMAFKIFKKKKKILSEPILGEQKIDKLCTKPIIYYSIDKKEYVTVYVPKYMNIYTNVHVNTNQSSYGDINQLSYDDINESSYGDINQLSYDDINELSCNTNELSCNTNELSCHDKLDEIYDYYLNNNQQVEEENENGYKGKNETKNENVHINNNSKNLDYITNHFQYDIDDDIYYYSTQDRGSTQDRRRVYSDTYSVYSDVYSDKRYFNNNFNLTG